MLPLHYNHLLMSTSPESNRIFSFTRAVHRHQCLRCLRKYANHYTTASSNHEYIAERTRTATFFFEHADRFKLSSHDYKSSILSTELCMLNIQYVKEPNCRNSWARTNDLRFMSTALYHLSYIPDCVFISSYYTT